MGKFIDMTGWIMKEHGIPDSRIIVIHKAEDYISPNGEKLAQWECKCSCGNLDTFVILGQSIRSGNTLSCGCYHRERSSKMCKERNVSKYKNSFINKNNYYEVYDKDGNMFVIDVDDYDKVSQTYWAKYESSNYFKSSINGKNVWLHRFIMNANNDEYVDHKNNDFNDYRKCNLRICDNSENNRNIGLQKNNSSGITGVNWSEHVHKWRARITIYGEEKDLGFFDSKEEAAIARKIAEDKYFKDFSYRRSQESSTYVK